MKPAITLVFMELSQALKIIKINLKKNLVESKHSKLQCQKRGLDIAQILETAREGEILGILVQGKDLYKTWFAHGKNKDLNIILRIINKKKLKIVTLFPCDSGRRKR